MFQAISSRRFFVLGALAGAMLPGCGGEPAKKTSGNSNTVAAASRIRGGGSSFIGPMMELWKAAYEKTEIDYQVTGSGDGVQKLLAKERDFGCTDAPLSNDQLEKAGGPDSVLQIPLAMGAVVPVYNLPGLSEPLNFTGDLLAEIYLGKITKWNDPAIAKVNPGAKLPDLNITVCARADGSGTSHIWTSYLSLVSPTWKEKVGASTQPKWPVGQQAPKNAGVAKLVEDKVGALGYVELIYALEKKSLSNGKVQNADKSDFLAGSLESVSASAANLKEIPENLVFSLLQQAGKDSYPICGTVWLVAHTKTEVSKAEALKGFVRYATGEGQELCSKKHYAKLPKNLVEKVVASLDKLGK
jgi:phosphate transport system substrate-binding protein